MKRNVMLTLFAFSLVVFVWLLIPHGERQFNWNPDSQFLHDDDEPFGSELFDKMAEATLPNGYSYYQGSLDDLLSPKERRSLLLVCDEMTWDEDAVERIDSFVRRGNKLMLVCNRCYGAEGYAWIRDTRTKRYFSKNDLKEVLKGHLPPDTLYCTNGDRIPVPYPLLTSCLDYCLKAMSTSSIGPVLGKKELQKRRNEEMKTVLYTYDGDTIALPDPYESEDSLLMEYSSREDFESAVQSAEMSVDDYLSDVKNEYVSMTVSVGKGTVYLVTCPLLFTNYGVLDAHISRFVGWQMSQIADRPVVRFSYALVNQRYMSRDDSSSFSSTSPLYYMLDRPPLRWAIYTLLAAIVLFMLFTSRRRQRRIPVLDLPRNRNLSFVQLLGTIYYRRHDNADLLRKKYTYFREELRRSMLLDINDTSEKVSHQVRLAQKTGLDEARIAETLSMVQELTSKDAKVSDGKLRECIDRMNEIIEKIYK